jgi:threonylcarbamoyladenosine tRNA methylthiotransferase CDKAL1
MVADSRKRSKVFVKSFGCSCNLADGEFIAGCLIRAGFDIAKTAQEAEVLIYNTCAVKTPTENRVIELLKRASLIEGKRLVVTGCLPKINYDRLKSEVAFDAALGPNCADSIVDVLAGIKENEHVVCLETGGHKKRKASLNLPRLAANPVISVVPVGQGCLGSCSYCCVVFARGRLQSYTIEDILRRVKQDLAAGAREIWLTGQDTACYGRDIGFNLVDLLSEICKVQGQFLVRVGMMTPNLVLDMMPGLVEAFRNDHVFKFVHLPVQSGDSDVLKRMNRYYLVDDFRQIVETFRKTIPAVTLATDVIVGFPTESPKAFGQTLQLIEEVKPDIVNVSKFFPRPGTAAEKMTSMIPPSEVKERSQKMTNSTGKISFEKNRAWVDWEGQILIDEIGKQPNSLIGRNFAYKPIVIKNCDLSLVGESVNVRVSKAFTTYLEATITDSLNS